MASIISIVARLFVWYTIITFAFRCPSTPADLTDDSPRICSPYLQTKDFVSPYVQPYYDAYVGDRLSPYVDQYYTPAATFAKGKYDTYGAPKVAQAQTFLQSEWERTLKPQWEAARDRAQAQFDSAVEPFTPYFRQASDAVNPYYTKALTTVGDGYDSYVLPTYEYMLPYGQQGYALGHNVMVHHVIPYVHTVKRASFAYLRIFYGESIEPQLTRISERLARYRDAKKLEAAVEDMDSSSSTSAAESSTSDPPAITATIPATDDASETPPAENKRSREEIMAEAQVKITEDLQKWQEKFAKACDQAAEDLEQRIAEITSNQIESQAHGVGNALLVQLEEAGNSALNKAKSHIKELSEGLPEDATEADFQSAYDKARSTIHSLGQSVKSKGEAILSWQEGYDEETDSLVRTQAKSTLSTIEHIRDLGLGEIGMRWAWMDGVTYQDWAKYKALRKEFDQWVDEVEHVATRHLGLKKAHEEGEIIHNKGMDMARKLVDEFNRLKEAAHYKIHMRDASDDFSKTELPVTKKAMSAAEVVKDAVAGSESTASETPSEGVLSSASEKIGAASSDASSAAVSEASEASEAAAGASSAIKDTVDDVSSEVGDKAGTVLDAAKHKTDQAESTIKGTPASESQPAASHTAQKVLGGVSAGFVEAREAVLDDVIDDDSGLSASEKIQSVVDDLGDRAADVTKAVSEAIYGATPTQGTVESVTSVANDQWASACAAASSALYGTEQGTVESLTSVASEKYAQAVTAASYAVYGTPTPVAQSIAAEASSKYDAAIQAAKDHYSNAISRASEQISGTPQPVHEQMFSSIESAYSGAVVAASSRLQDAVGVLPTSTQNAWESISSVASSRLSDGLSQASAQYTSAKIALGAEPTPAQQQFLADAQRRYYEGVGLAHARYSEFLDAASTAVYGTPTPAYQSVAGEASKAIFGTPAPAYESWLSSASSQYNDAVGLASEKFGSIMASAESAAGKTSKSPAQSVLDSASHQYDAAVAAASSSLAAASSKASEAIYGTEPSWTEAAASQVAGSWDAASSKASEAVYGTEPSWTETAASQAVQNWEALVSKASEQVYGQPTPWTESVYSQAGGYAAQATLAAASQYSAVQSLVSELVSGKEPDFTESVMSRFNSAYATGLPGVASSASSYAADAYASASSVITSVFTPPPTLEAILNSASDQINSAVDAASVQVYGSEKGTFEQATSSLADAASAASASASEAVYGTPVGYAEAAQSSFDAVISSANKAISDAIYGTPTGTVEAATSGAASVYSSLSSVASEQAESVGSIVSAKVSEAVYGPQQGAVESASSRLAGVLEGARSRMAEFAAGATGSVQDAAESVGSVVSEATSKAGEAVSSASSKAKDEL